MRALVILGIIAITGLHGPARAETKILFNVLTPQNHHIVTKMIVPWVRTIEKASKGRIKFQIPPKNMGPAPRQLDMVRAGVADMAYTLTPFLRKSAPLLQISSLPLLGTTGEASGVALWRTYQRYFKGKNQLPGLVLLGFFAGQGGGICTMTDNPVDSVKALQAQKTWSQPGFPAQALKLMDVPVVAGPALTVYQLVSKGVVDAFASLSILDNYSFKIQQFAKSCTRVPGALFTPTFVMAINPKKWASMSARDRKTIRDNSGEKIARLSRHGWDDLIRPAEQKYVSSGGKIIEPSKSFVAAMRKTWKPLHERWIKEADKLGVKGREAFSYFVTQSKKVAGEK